MNSGDNLLRGVIAPALTPFREDHSIDFPVLERYIDWLCGQELDGIFAMGGSGEYQTLSLEERKQLMDCFTGVVRNRNVLIVGCGGKDLQETLMFSEYAQDRGADAVGIVVPEILPPDEERLFQYFQEVNRHVTVPIMVYDPYGEGDFSVSPELMVRMGTELSHIAGIKYRSVNGENMARMALAIAGKLSLISGNEATFLQDLAIGAVGCIGGGASIYPHWMSKLLHLAEAGDLPAARRIQFQILTALQVLNTVSWPLSGKIVLRELGIPFQPVTRIPASSFHQRDGERIRLYFHNLINSREWI